MYINIYIQESLNKFTDFFSYGHMKHLEVISSGSNALVVPFQQLLEAP